MVPVVIDHGKGNGWLKERTGRRGCGETASSRGASTPARNRRPGWRLARCPCHGGGRPSIGRDSSIVQQHQLSDVFLFFLIGLVLNCRKKTHVIRESKFRIEKSWCCSRAMDHGVLCLWSSLSFNQPSKSFNAEILHFWNIDQTVARFLKHDRAQSTARPFLLLWLTLLHRMFSLHCSFDIYNRK